MQTVCERMKRNEVTLNERTLCLLPFLEDGTCRTRRNVVSVGGMQYGRSERSDCVCIKSWTKMAFLFQMDHVQQVTDITKAQLLFLKKT